MKRIILCLVSASLGCALISPCRSFYSDRHYRRHNAVETSIELLPIETPANEIGTEYLQFILPNGIPTTLVREPGSEKSSASLAVKAGAQDDPRDRQGLAHFTEHAVFLGSKKFPEERAYKEFLSKNGGSSNAGTGMESTVYKFEVNSKAFTHAVDLFSQFFKEPLFADDAIAREVMAVDAEDSKNRILDGRRVLQVTKHVMLPEHPYSKFSTGNVKTLAGGDAEKNAAEVTTAMRSFHVNHYRPENMALSLVGPQKLDDLKDLAISMFADIKSPESQHLSVDIERDSASAYFASMGDKDIFALHPAYPFQSGNIVLRVKPVKDVRDLSVMWSIPSMRDLYRSEPARLIGFILGHRGPGSVFAALQDKGWATSVSAGSGTEYADFSIFEASVSLTEEGLDHWEEIVEIVYNHLHNIESMEDAELLRIWNEMRATGAVDFRFREKATAYELAPHLAGNMLNYPLHHAVSAGWLLDDLDIQLFRQLLQRIIPQNAITMLRSQKFSWLPDDTPTDTLSTPPADTAVGKGANRKEPWYGVSYHQQVPSDDLYNSWERARKGQGPLSPGGAVELTLPTPNPYICYELAEHAATESKLKVSDIESNRPLRSSPPSLLVGQSAGASAVDVTDHMGSAAGNTHRNDAKVDTVWHSRDEAFGQPRSVFNCLLRTSGCSDGHPENSLLSSVYGQIAARNLYNAAVGGLSYSVNAGIRGVSLSVSGYSPKLATLATKVFSEFGSPAFWSSVDPSIVNICKERMLRGLRSWTKDRPDTQCDALMSYLLQEHIWLPSDRIAAAEAITASSLVARAHRALRRTHVTSYVHGDLTPFAALSLHNDCIAVLDANAAVHAEKCTFTDADHAAIEDKEVPSRARAIPAGHHVVALPGFNPDDPNSALLTHIQMAVSTARNVALIVFLRSLMGEPLFSELRTKKQLGYVVSLGTAAYGRHPGTLRGLTVRLLSNRFSPPAMQDELASFFESQKAVFAALTQEEVSHRAESIVKSLQDPPTSYSEEAGGFWSSVITGMPFDWTEQVIAEVQAVTADSVREAADQWLFDAEKRRSVSVMMFGSGHLDDLNKLSATEGTVEEADKTAAAHQQEASGSFFPNSKTVVRSLSELTALRDGLTLFE